MQTNYRILIGSKREKALYNKLQRTLDLLNEVLSHQRDSEIALPILLHHSVTTNDIAQFVEGLIVTQEVKNEIKETFDDEWLEERFDHYWEGSGEWFMDTLRCAEISEQDIKKMVKDCTRTWPAFRSGNGKLDQKLRRTKTLDSAIKKIRSFFSKSLARHEMLHLLSGDDMATNSDNSWMYIGEANVFEEHKNKIIAVLEKYFADKNSIQLWDVINKKQWRKAVRRALFVRDNDDHDREDMGESSLNYISTICTASLLVIEEGTNYFKKMTKSDLMYEVVCDIEIFLKESDISWETTEEAVGNWINGAGYILTRGKESTHLRIEPEHRSTIEFSCHRTIEIETAFNLYTRLKAIVKGKESNEVSTLQVTDHKIKSFVQKGNDYILTVDCTKFSWKQIIQFAENYLIPEMKKRRANN